MNPGAHAEFWRWFLRNAAQVATITDAKEPIAIELARALERIDPDLTFELSLGQPPRELVISASGLKRAFPAVIDLVAAAPEVPGWRIVAFRQPSPRKFSVEIHGHRLSPDDLWFVAERHGDRCGLTLFMRHYQPGPGVEEAAYLMLDGALGEYDVETKVGFIEFAALPPDPEARGLLPLVALPAEVRRILKEMNDRTHG